MHHALIGFAFCILLLPTSSRTSIIFTFIGQGAFLLSSPIVVPLVVDGCVEAETVVLRGVLSGIGGRATLDSMAHYKTGRVMLEYAW